MSRLTSRNCLSAAKVITVPSRNFDFTRDAAMKPSEKTSQAEACATKTMTNDQDLLNGASVAPADDGGLQQPAPNDGRIAPLDGSRTALTASQARHAVSLQGLDASHPFGLNNERLEEMRPDLVNALRELEVQYRQEGIVARRHEIRRIRQARLFWQGLQYAWWNPQDMTWHLPYESKSYDDRAMAEMPRYQFVTNIYQAFGLSFVSVLSQDVPATRFLSAVGAIDCRRHDGEGGVAGVHADRAK